MTEDKEILDPAFPPDGGANPSVPPEEDKPEETAEIVGVRFREGGKIYYFAPGTNRVNVGDPVIVESIFFANGRRLMIHVGTRHTVNTTPIHKKQGNILIGPVTSPNIFASILSKNLIRSRTAG